MTLTRLLPPQEMAVHAQREPRWMRLPEPAALFGEREMRLRQLAPGHLLADYLLWAAELCEAQHQEAQQGPIPPVPAAAVFERAAASGLPPLPALTWGQDAHWHEVLSRQRPAC